jgi:hypothetical protein
MYFEKHRVRQKRQRCSHGWIKTFQVPDLRDALASGSERNKFIGFHERGGKRFFNQHVDAGVHQIARHFEVMKRRRSNRRGLQFAVRGEHLLNRAKSLAAELSGNGVGTVQVRINNSEQADRFSLLLQFLVDSGMIAPEDAYADDRDRNRFLRRQLRNSRWPVAGMKL